MTQHLDDRLRDAHARIDPGPVPDSTRARLDALIAGAPAGRPSPLRTWRPRPATIGFAGAGLTVAALLMVALLPGSSGTTGPATARAACASAGPVGPCGAALRQVAGAWQVPGNGSILYRRGSWSVTAFTVTAKPTGGPNEVTLPAAQRSFVAERLGTEEQWIAPDGSGRTAHTDPGTVTLPTAQDRAAWVAAGRPDLETLVPGLDIARPLASDFPAATANKMFLGANGLYDSLAHDGDPLADVPRTSAALVHWLQQKAWERRIRPRDECPASLAGCTDGQRRLVQDTVVSDIETLLGFPGTPPELRAALVTVLTQQDGARSLGIIRDPENREVAAVQLGEGRHDGDGGNVVAFDPASGELRGIGAKSGREVRWYRTIAVVSARVENVGEKP